MTWFYFSMKYFIIDKMKFLKLHHSTSISRTAIRLSLSRSLLSFSLLALKIKWIHFDRLWIFCLEQVERDSVPRGTCRRWFLAAYAIAILGKRDRSIRYGISFDARTYRYRKSRVQQSRITGHTKTVVVTTHAFDWTQRRSRGGFRRWLLLSTDARRNRRF